MGRAMGVALAVMLLLAASSPVSSEGYEALAGRLWCRVLMLDLLGDFEAAGFVEPEFSDLLESKCVAFLRDWVSCAEMDDRVGHVPVAILEHRERCGT